MSNEDSQEAIIKYYDIYGVEEGAFTIKRSMGQPVVAKPT